MLRLLPLHSCADDIQKLLFFSHPTFFAVKSQAICFPAVEFQLPYRLESFLVQWFAGVIFTQ